MAGIRSELGEKLWHLIALLGGIPLVDARMRAAAASILFLIINLIGLGLGPPLIGLMSDWTAAATFSQHANGSFATLCAAGTQLSEFKAACTTASARGIAAGLISVSGILAWASVHFWLAGVCLKRNTTQPR